MSSEQQVTGPFIWYLPFSFCGRDCVFLREGFLLSAGGIGKNLQKWKKEVEKYVYNLSNTPL
jgi:hypothetical protein